MDKIKPISLTEIPRIRIHQSERYLPTAFDESLTILEKINRVIHYLYEYSELTEKMVLKWNEVYHWVMNEGLESSIGDRLNEWYNNGKFDEILERVLLSEYLKKDEFNELKDELKDEFNELKDDVNNSIDSFINELNTLIKNIENEKKELNIDLAKNMFLFNMNLHEFTVNQGIAYDEINDHLFASQSFNDDISEGNFIITRMDRYGNKIDSMFIRGGGHGTSFGVEIINDSPYIWSNMIKYDNNYRFVSQHLVRFKYQSNSEIDYNSNTVQKFNEHPIDNFTQTPMVDNKNKLIAIRETREINGNNVSKVEVFNISDVEKNNFNVKYNFSFTNEMNNQTLQGLTFDDNKLYLSFGNNVTNFMLYVIDMSKNEITHRLNAKQIGLPSNNELYLGNMSEPEGMYLYTDPNTGSKTLLHVIVSSTTRIREQLLFGFSSNEGYKHFIGGNFLNKKDKGTTLDGFSKPIPNTNRISDIMEYGWYYMSSAQMNEMIDSPDKGAGSGFWLYVSGKDTGGSVKQWLYRNSLNHTYVYKRQVTKNGVQEWEGMNILANYKNGFKNYYSSSEPLQFMKYSNILHIYGIITKEGSINTGDIITTLPFGYRPYQKHTLLCSTGKGLCEIIVSTNGDVSIGNLMLNDNPNFIHVEATIPMQK